MAGEPIWSPMYRLPDNERDVLAEALAARLPVKDTPTTSASGIPVTLAVHYGTRAGLIDAIVEIVSAAAPSPDPLPREALAEARRRIEALALWDKRTVPGGYHINRAAVLAILDAALSPDRPTPPADPDPTIGMQIVKCPHCGEELSVWPPDRPTLP